MSRILLTGSTGQVGHELRHSLSVLGEVIAPLRAAPAFQTWWRELFGADDAAIDRVLGGAHARGDRGGRVGLLPVGRRALAAPRALRLARHGRAPVHRVLAAAARRGVPLPRFGRVQMTSIVFGALGGLLGPVGAAVGSLAGTRPRKPPVDVLTPAIGALPDGTSSTYTPGDMYWGIRGTPLRASFARYRRASRGRRPWTPRGRRPAARRSDFRLSIFLRLSLASPGRYCVR